MKILNRKTVLPVILKLMDKNILTIHEEINEVYKPKLIRYIKLHSQYDNNDGLAELIETLKKSEKQKGIVLQYFQLKIKEIELSFNLLEGEDEEKFLTKAKVDMQERRNNFQKGKGRGKPGFNRKRKGDNDNYNRNKRSKAGGD